jgi:hypothetical protein
MIENDPGEIRGFLLPENEKSGTGAGQNDKSNKNGLSHYSLTH